MPKSVCFCATLSLYALIALGTPCRADAQIIFDNGAPTADGGSIASDFSFPRQSANDFVLSSSQTINRVDWWGQYAFSNTPTTPDDFTVRIFADAAGAPALNPLYQSVIGDVGRTNSGPASFGLDTFAYSSSIPEIALGAGTYWLSIVNNTPLDTNDDWFWSRVTRFTGNIHDRASDGQAWITVESETAFRLAVPEPGTATLLAAAVVTLLLRRRVDHDRALTS